MITSLQHKGFVLRKAFVPAVSTQGVAQDLGTTVNVGALLPASGIRTVRSLRPRKTNEVWTNRYSGTYGSRALSCPHRPRPGKGRRLQTSAVCADPPLRNIAKVFRAKKRDSTR